MITVLVHKAVDASVKPVGEFGLALIKERTISGKGVNNRRATKLKALEESTKKSRRLKQLSPLTTPQTSNLTESGQMLDSLKISNKIQTRGPQIIIQANTVKDRHKSRFHKKTGRNFLDFTNSDDDRLTLMVAEKIVAALKKIKIG